MDEFLVALLVAIFEMLGEAIFEIVSELLVALLFRVGRRLVVNSLRVGPLIATLSYALLGVLIGALSVIAFPHPFFRPSKIHGISLLISPFVTGLVMSQIGTSVRRRGHRSVRIESFGYGFTFALAMALLRFFFAR